MLRRILLVSILIVMFTVPAEAMVHLHRTNPSFETQVYIVKNGTLYGYRLLNVNSAAELYFQRGNKVHIVYGDYSHRFTTWGGWYYSKENCLFLCGQYFDGYAFRSVVFKWYLNNNTVSFIRLPNTGDANELMSVIIYHGDLFVGERVHGGGTWATIYPDGGGVWRVPVSQWNNASAWSRIWENPYHFGMDRFAILNGTLYAFGKNRTSFGLWKYNTTAGSFSKVMVHLNVVSNLENVDPWAWAGDAFWEPRVNELVIAYCNGTTGKVDLIVFNGSSSEHIQTNIPYGSFGVKVTYHKMPNGNLAILIYSINGYWHALNGTKVYLYSLENRTSTCIGSMSSKTSYIINPFVYLNNTCLVIGEHNGWTGEKSGPIVITYDDPASLLQNKFSKLDDHKFNIVVCRMGDLVKPAVRVTSKDYTGKEVGLTTISKHGGYWYIYLKVPDNRPDIYHICVNVCDKAFGVSKSYSVTGYTYCNGLFVGGNILVGNKTVFSTESVETQVKLRNYMNKTIYVCLEKYIRKPTHTNQTVLQIKFEKGVVIGKSVVIQAPLDVKYVDIYLNGKLVLSGAIVKNGELNMTLTPFMNGSEYTFVAISGVTSPVYLGYLWVFIALTLLSTALLAVYLFFRHQVRSAIVQLERRGRYFGRVK